MRNIFYTIVITLVALVFVACNPQPQALRLLAEAESLVESNPDSAMLLIDFLFYPEKSRSRNYFLGSVSSYVLNK